MKTLSEIIESIKELKKYVKLTEKEEKDFQKVVKVYPFRSSVYYALLSKKSKAVRKMLLPSAEEIENFQELPEDPFNEGNGRIVRRYPDRALIITTNFCAVLCRFCMRKRNWKRPKFFLNEEEILKIESFLKENPKIHDVIISGGDPLLLPTDILEKLIHTLEKLENIEVIRIGTRLPAVYPKRILNSGILDILRKTKKVWMNVHFNHPDEVTDEAVESLHEIARAGIPLNNQCVLLREINDSLEVQEKLIRKLRTAKVRAYYLFACDPVRGTYHFSVPVERGIKIVDQLLERVSPMFVPYFAIDTMGGHGKAILFPKRHEINEKFLIVKTNKGKLLKINKP